MAHSALQRRVRISSRGTAERLESLRSIAWRLRIAFISTGAPAGMLAWSASSSPCTCAIAASNRASSASISCAPISYWATSRRAVEKRCAWPIAMPPETPAPCSVKLAAMAPVFSPSFTSLLFPEALADQLDQRGERGFGILALGFDENAAALAGGEHHHPHDALRVHAATVARQPNLGREGAGDLGELGRGARVQAQFVHDFSFGLRHCRRPR